MKPAATNHTVNKLSSLFTQEPLLKTSVVDAFKDSTTADDLELAF